MRDNDPADENDDDLEDEDLPGEHKPEDEPVCDVEALEAVFDELPRWTIAQYIQTTYEIGRSIGASDEDLVDMLAESFEGGTVPEIVRALRKHGSADWLTPELYDRLVREVERIELEQQGKKILAETWERRDYLQYLYFHGRAERFDVLQKILTQGGPLTDRERAELVREAWINSQFIYPNLAGWCRTWLSLSDPQLAMDPDDIAALAALPDPFTVFRGQNGAGPNELGISWSIDREKAIYFARRLLHRNTPLLISGRVAKKHIFAYFGGSKDPNNEYEVVVLPKFIKDREHEWL